MTGPAPTNLLPSSISIASVWARLKPHTEFPALAEQAIGPRYGLGQIGEALLVARYLSLADAAHIGLYRVRDSPAQEVAGLKPLFTNGQSVLVTPRSDAL